MMHRMRVQHCALFVPACEGRAYNVKICSAVADVLAEAIVVVAIQVDEKLLVVETSESCSCRCIVAPYVKVNGVVSMVILMLLLSQACGITNKIGWF